MSKTIDLTSGIHFFYGQMQLNLIEGEADVEYYQMKTGVKYNIFAPLYDPPIQILAKTNISIEISPKVSSECRSTVNHFYEPPKKIKFSEIVDGCYQIIEDICYTEHSSLIKEEIEEKCSIEKEYKVYISSNEPSCSLKYSRYVTNYLLNKFQKVYYIDLSPKNPEFAHPLYFSISLVSKPILEPSSLHLSTPYYKSLYCRDEINNRQQFFNEILKLPENIKKQYPIVVRGPCIQKSDDFGIHNETILLLNVKCGFLFTDKEVEGFKTPLKIINFNNFIEEPIMEYARQTIRFHELIKKNFSKKSLKNTVALILEKFRMFFSNGSSRRIMNKLETASYYGYIGYNNSEITSGKNIDIDHETKIFGPCIIRYLDRQNGTLIISYNQTSNIEKANFIVVSASVPPEHEKTMYVKYFVKPIKFTATPSTPNSKFKPYSAVAAIPVKNKPMNRKKRFWDGDGVKQKYQEYKDDGNDYSGRGRKYMGVPPLSTEMADEKWWVPTEPNEKENKRKTTRRRKKDHQPIFQRRYIPAKKDSELVLRIQPQLAESSDNTDDAPVEIMPRHARQQRSRIIESEDEGELGPLEVEKPKLKPKPKAKGDIKLTIERPRKHVLTDFN